jgi:cytochrome c oxidase subunit 3
MASFPTTVPVDDSRISSGDDGIRPPIRDGGDDDRPAPGSPDYSTRLRRARLGLLVALTPILMLFVSFTSAYIVRQGLPTLDPATNMLVRDWIPLQLPKLLFFNTCILLLSSVAIELARRHIHGEAALAHTRSIAGVTLGGEKKPAWLALTLVLGFCFLFGQWLAWRQLAARGFYVSTTPSSSFVYLLTGMHALHLLGGVFALGVAGILALLRRPVETRSIVVDVTAWYWHFMALLWVYILCLLEFAR